MTPNVCVPVCLSGLFAGMLVCLFVSLYLSVYLDVALVRQYVCRELRKKDFGDILYKISFSKDCFTCSSACFNIILFLLYFSILPRFLRFFYFYIIFVRIYEDSLCYLRQKEATTKCHLCCIFYLDY